MLSELITADPPRPAVVPRPSEPLNADGTQTAAQAPPHYRDEEAHE